MNTRCLLSLFLVCAFVQGIAQGVGAQWQMEMGDRWGTGRPATGPDLSTFETELKP